MAISPPLQRLCSDKSAGRLVAQGRASWYHKAPFFIRAKTLQDHKEELDRPMQLEVTQIEVRVPALLRSCTKEKTRFMLEATTLADALERLVLEYPLLRRHLYDETGQQRQHVLIFYNDDNIKWLERLDVPLKSGDRLSVVQAVSGGAGCLHRIAGD
jgi:molybdopterin synthase sulfur carrier subunit